jgi:hypothetical protein
MNLDRTPRPPSARRSCMLPWLLLAVVLVGLVGTAWWGYQKKEEVAQYAVSSLLDQQLDQLLPEGVDATRMAVRVAAIMKAVREGRFDPEQIRGMGAMFRDYYTDRVLDRLELESLLAFAEAAVRR